MRKLTIGRLPDNDIVLNDISVSRNHSVIDISGDEYCVHDLGSSNGTFVNGIRINGSTSLKRNDILKVGNALVPWMNYIGNQAYRTQYTPSPPVIQVQNSHYSTKQKLPNSSASLTLGIIGLILSLGFIGLILNILAITLGAGAISRYNNEPEKYTESSFSQAKAGKVLGIIGLSLFGIVLLLVIAAYS